MSSCQTPKSNVKLKVTENSMPILNMLALAHNMINNQNVNISELYDTAAYVAAKIDANIPSETYPQMSNVLSQKNDKNDFGKAGRFSISQNKLYRPVPIKISDSITSHLVANSMENFDTHKDNKASIGNNLGTNMAAEFIHHQNHAKNYQSGADSKYKTSNYNIDSAKHHEDYKKNIESSSEECSFDNLPNSQYEHDPSPLLAPGKKSKRSVRKQTSFAKTDVRSITDSYEDNNNVFTDSDDQKHQLYKTSLRNQDGVLWEKTNPSFTVHNDANIHIKKYEYTQNVQAKADSAGNTSGPKMIGLLTEHQRKVKVQNYLDKKKRKRANNVRYHCRQNLAKERFRYQGRFIKLEDLPLHSKHYIIDFNSKRLIKPIFQIDRVNKRQRKIDRAQAKSSSLH